jgi:hypothetical protein
MVKIKSSNEKKKPSTPANGKYNKALVYMGSENTSLYKYYTLLKKRKSNLSLLFRFALRKKAEKEGLYDSATKKWDKDGLKEKLNKAYNQSAKAKNNKQKGSN